jgi:hypothetical protein
MAAQLRACRRWSRLIAASCLVLAFEISPQELTELRSSL